MEPITQAQNAEAKTDNSAPGAEARIAELTKAHGEAERQRQATEQQLNELKLKYENMANGVAASLGVKTEPPAPTIDSNLQAAINAAMGPHLQRLEQLYGSLKHSDAQRTLEETYQRNAVPDPVRKKAQEIYNEYAKKGVILREDVVVNQAWGIVARDEHLKTVQANAQRGNFNMPYQNFGNGAGLPLASHTNIEKPANFDSLSPREQVQWYEKHVGDKPL